MSSWRRHARSIAALFLARSFGRELVNSRGGSNTVVRRAWGALGLGRGSRRVRAISASRVKCAPNATSSDGRREPRGGERTGAEAGTERNAAADAGRLRALTPPEAEDGRRRRLDPGETLLARRLS